MRTHTSTTKRLTLLALFATFTATSLSQSVCGPVIGSGLQRSCTVISTSTPAAVAGAGSAQPTGGNGGSSGGSTGPPGGDTGTSSGGGSSGTTGPSPGGNGGITSGGGGGPPGGGTPGGSSGGAPGGGSSYGKECKQKRDGNSDCEDEEEQQGPTQWYIISSKTGTDKGTFDNYFKNLTNGKDLSHSSDGDDWQDFMAQLNDTQAADVKRQSRVGFVEVLAPADPDSNHDENNRVIPSRHNTASSLSGAVRSIYSLWKRTVKSRNGTKAPQLKMLSADPSSDKGFTREGAAKPPFANENLNNYAGSWSVFAQAQEDVLQGPGGSEVTVTGTSFAAPQVAGLAAYFLAHPPAGRAWAAGSLAIDMKSNISQRIGNGDGISKT